MIQSAVFFEIIKPHTFHSRELDPYLVQGCSRGGHAAHHGVVLGGPCERGAFCAVKRGKHLWCKTMKNRIVAEGRNRVEDKKDKENKSNSISLCVCVVG